MFRLIILFILVQIAAVFTYKVNDSDYNRMPPLYQLDGFEECFDEPDSIYCYAEFVLVSDEPNELFTYIEEFSDNPRHFNHTLLRRGYCMTKTCNDFYNVSNTEMDLRLTFEACANKTIYDKYKLKTRVSVDNLDCSKRYRDLPIDYLDMFIGGICILIVMANIIGSLCDRYLDKGKEQGSLRFLYCFSCFRNWKKFIAPAGENRDPRFKTLTGIHGIRAINMASVVIGHAVYVSAVFLTNPEMMEGLYDVKFFNIFMNGSIVMQSFFLTSSFLLVYNWLIDTEKRPLSWSMLPMQIMMRWLRLTPAYALVTGLTVTWFSRLASGGPAWNKIIYNEVRDCRQNWWKHLLYFNNYIDRTYCMVNSWYLAADTQLYIFAVILFLLCRTNLTRKVVLSFFFVVGLITPMLHTYFQELQGVLIAAPDVVFNLFMGDPTFEKNYSKAHTNIAGCIIGMALGYIIYYWQKSGGDPKQFQKYRYLYWSLPGVMILVLFAGHIFFAAGPPLPIYLHVIYAGLQKPAFGLVVAAIIAGLVIQFEGLFRPILEWRPFVFLSRLSYSAYLLHLPYVRTEAASILNGQRLDMFVGAISCFTILVGVYIASFFFCMMVEMPFANIITSIFRRPHTEEYKNETDKETKTIENDNGTDVNQAKTEDGTIVIKMGSKI
ncbi:hypothetical protein PYW08_005388 [Mythimna loreyi]|uniref:Uncharacterized protein n=1 Tax=Mythimna loreyi TaxID=667449 RepID=A0ACC2QIZ4_9NEOP|nr:hypothetical protein PYW08_005388 [Mythimna loreyi]